jgi:hypothetical protein
MNSSYIGELFTKLFVLLLGFIFLIPSLYKLCSYCVFRYQSVEVYGSIDSPLWGRNFLGGKSIVQYKDAFGKIHEIRSKVRIHWFHAPEKGEKVKVLFSKRDPKIAFVDSKFYYVLLPLCFSAVGATFVFSVLRSAWQKISDYRRRWEGEWGRTKITIRKDGTNDKNHPLL